MGCSVPMITRTLPADVDLLYLHRLDPARYPVLLESSATGPHGRWDMLLLHAGESFALGRDGVVRDQHGARSLLVVSWLALDPCDIVDGWVTSPARTVLYCATALPFADLAEQLNGRPQPRHLCLRLRRVRVPTESYRREKA